MPPTFFREKGDKLIPYKLYYRKNKKKDNKKLEKKDFSKMTFKFVVAI